MTTSQKSEIGVAQLWKQFLPLSVSDVTMALGDPLITASVARLPLAVASLAAIGVAKSLAVFFESPIIMVLHASNALAASAKARLAMKRFVLLAAVVLTAAMAFLVLTPMFGWVAGRVMGIQGDLLALSHRALLYLLLWPAVIAWRRYYQGLLIHQGHGRHVAKAGIVRLGVVALSLLAGLALGLHGVDVAGGALILGVSSEAIAVTWLARRTKTADSPTASFPPGLPTDVRGVFRFYWPLGNSMLVVWGGRALLVAVVARAVDATTALAAWPAAWGLTLVLANATRMVQQVVIRNRDTVPQALLLRFAASVGLAFSALLLTAAVTPLGQSMVRLFVGGDVALAAAIGPVLVVCAIVPAMVALQNAIQGLLIADRRTGRVNLSTWLGTGALLIVAMVMVERGAHGATAAAVSMVAALGLETLVLAAGLKPGGFNATLVNTTPITKSA